MLKSDCNALHKLHHRVVLEHRQQQAAIKIQTSLRRYIAQKDFKEKVAKIVKIQRWVRNRVNTLLQIIMMR